MVAIAPLDADSSGGCWEICRLYVHPERHGTDLGRRLLHEAERHAIAAGAADLVLWTDTRFHRAHRFYEKQGYVRRPGVRIPCPGVVEYRYEKPIDGAPRDYF